ncbi:MAG: NAD kinase [Bacteroidia bacterium]
MKICIYGRPGNANQVELAEGIINLLRKKGHTVCLHEQYDNFLKDHLKLDASIKRISGYEELKEQSDFVFSIGGDGTLLDTVFLVRDSNIPVVGINAGRLGFLSSISSDKIESAIDSLDKGHYSLDPRTLLRLESNHPIFGGDNVALNEFTIHKKETSSMITIHTYLNGEYLNSYWADGIMISTPTGSTGYSMSCGGPIMVPQSESFVITPIAPHNLTVRPIVVSDKNVISLEVEGRSQHFMATLDSRSVTIDSSYQLAVRKENYSVNLVRLSNENFLTTLRKKLNWGLDTRN